MTVEVKINPAKQGENVADVYLVRRDGTLQQVPELTARLLARTAAPARSRSTFRRPSRVTTWRAR